AEGAPIGTEAVEDDDRIRRSAMEDVDIAGRVMSNRGHAAPLEPRWRGGRLHAEADGDPVLEQSTRVWSPGLRDVSLLRRLPRGQVGSRLTEPRRGRRGGGLSLTSGGDLREQRPGDGQKDEDARREQLLLHGT